MRQRVKNRKFYFSMAITIVVLFCATIVVEKSINLMNTSTNYLGYQIESQARDEVGDDLVRYATAIESDIKFNNLKAPIPNSVFSKYLNIFDDRRDINSIMIINAGYSFDDNNVNNTVNKIIDQINSGDKNAVRVTVDSLIQNLRKYDNSTNSENTDLNTLMNNAIQTISDESHMSKQDIQNILFKELFINNKVVLRTNKDSKETQINETELDNLLSTNSWNEWIAIPKGYLGVNDEAYVEEGRLNLKYNKYIVIANLNKDKILGPYNQYKQKTEKVTTSLLLVLIVFFILTLASCAVRFVQIIDRGDDIDPVVKSNNSNTDDDTYKLLDWLHSKLKQVRK